MNRCHPFAVRIEGDFTNTRQCCGQFFLGQALVFGGNHQGDFGRFAHCMHAGMLWVDFSFRVVA